MDKRKMTTYKLEVRPLTGLSINSGSTIDMASYVIEKDHCAVIDMNSFLLGVLHSGSDAQKHALTIALENATSDLAELKAFVTENCKEENVIYRSHVSQPVARKLLGNKGNLNINEIYRCKTENGYLPVIPGSSLKGAIRTSFSGRACMETAVFDDDTYDQIKDRIDNLSSIENERNKDRESKKIENEIDARILFSKSFISRAQAEEEKKITFSPQNSAMRNLQISDCFSQNAKTEIVSLSMPGRTMSKALPIIDVIRGKLMGCDSSFVGTLRIGNVSDIPHELSIENIIKDCNDFAKSMFDCEKEKIIDALKKRDNDYAFDRYAELERLIKKPLKDNEFLLRLGRFSQREFVTYSNNFRYVEKTKNEDRKWGSTRTMMYDGSQYLPLGWCLCSIS